MAGAYRYNVFINCPFDTGYKRIFEALVFTVHDCGYVARCALEADDSGQVRIDKIINIVRACRLGIHDISRTQLDRTTGLPRFNMPFELGLFLGAKRFGAPAQKSKATLILDTDRFRYQKYISDIAGQDVHPHGNDVRKAVAAVRDWLRHLTPTSTLLLGGGAIAQRYEDFLAHLPESCRRIKLQRSRLTFMEYVLFVEEWLKANPRFRTSSS